MRLLLGSLVFVICIIFACEVSLAAESYESTTLAKEHFAQHQFTEGKSVLINRLRTPGLTNAEKSAILGAMGDFYCEYAGDFRSGLSYYQRAQKSHLDNADFKKTRIEYILSCRKKYADIDKLVHEIRNKPNWLVNGPGTRAKIDTLKQFIVGSPDYYRVAELYYCLAIYNAGESKYLKALDYFNQAESLKPAIGYFIPLHGHFKIVHDRLIRRVVTISATSVFTFMFILSAALFYAAKPWHWLTLKNIGGFIILLVLLCGLFLAVGHLLATRYVNSESTQEMISVGEKYLYTSLNGPGFDIYAKFLMYIAAAFFLTYVFALGASALIRKKFVAVVLNSIAGTLIMASLVCIFYLRNCDMKTMDPPNVSPSAFLNTSNAVLLTIDGIEPYILTEPENFPNPGVSHNTNPPLEDWAREHCPFDDKDESVGK
ncbi:MAG TPA: hypothetical protein ENH94_06695 [Phycisphaerales bacterium]|nr:hypothetical protein [Phycisphaerales bacterium]